MRSSTLLRVLFCTTAIALLTTSATSATEVNRVPKGTNAKNAESCEPWVESFDEALRQSKATGRPVLLVFTGSDWCGWCVKMKNNVFATAKFNEWASRNVIMVEVDFPRRHQLASHIQQQNSTIKATYGQHVTSYPTVLFVDSEGNTIAKTGYDGQGPESFISTATSLIPAATASSDLALKK